MALKVSTGKQLACKIVDLRGIRRNEKQRLDDEWRLKKKGTKLTLFKYSRQEMLSKMTEKVEECVGKVEREIDILRFLSHVRLTAWPNPALLKLTTRRLVYSESLFFKSY